MKRIQDMTKAELVELLRTDVPAWNREYRQAYATGFRAFLRRAILGGAFLGGADLRGANLGGADLKGAVLGGAVGE